MPRLIVIGGGEAGVFYVRQLRRAAEAGRLDADEIVVVDRDPGCAVAREPRAGRRPAVRLDVATWDDWLDAHLDRFGPDDHLVPYHWAPHLLLGWLQRQMEATGARAEREGRLPARGLPYEGDTKAGDRALSYASWPCPPTCIEPALCPHTRGPRDWSLLGDLEAPDPVTDDRVVFRCLHLVYGVGSIPVSALHDARDRMRAGADAKRSWLVATSSHCHALAARLVVDRR